MARWLDLAFILGKISCKIKFMGFAMRATFLKYFLQNFNDVRVK